MLSANTVCIQARNGKRFGHVLGAAVVLMLSLTLHGCLGGGGGIECDVQDFKHELSKYVVRQGVNAACRAATRGAAGGMCSRAYKSVNKLFKRFVDEDLDEYFATELGELQEEAARHFQIWYSRQFNRRLSALGLEANHSSIIESGGSVACMFGPTRCGYCARSCSSNSVHCFSSTWAQESIMFDTDEECAEYTQAAITYSERELVDTQSGVSFVANRLVNVLCSSLKSAETPSEPMVNVLDGGMPRQVKAQVAAVGGWFRHHTSLMWVLIAVVALPVATMLGCLAFSRSVRRGVRDEDSKRAREMHIIIDSANSIAA